MEGKFPSKILAFVMVITHNCDSFFCWSQIFYILSSICEGFILPSQIRFFERAFWIRHKFLVANRLFFCSEKSCCCAREAIVEILGVSNSYCFLSLSLSLIYLILSLNVEVVDY